MSVAAFRRLLCNKQANVAITFGLAIVPLVFAVGFGIDYTSAAYREDQLNAFADFSRARCGDAGDDGEHGRRVHRRRDELVQCAGERNDGNQLFGEFRGERECG